MRVMPGAILYLSSRALLEFEMPSVSFRFLTAALSGGCFCLDWLDCQKSVFHVITTLMKDLNLVLIAV